MAKGYWIARIDVTDEEAYKSYIAANGVAFAKFGGEFVVRGGPFDAVEGASRQRNVVIAFPTLAAARACYDSAEYQAAKALRSAASAGDLIIISGYDGPQPGRA